MTVLPKLLDELDALYERATKGPWGRINNVVDIPGSGPERQSLHLNTEANAALIVSLVNAYPALRAAARDAAREIDINWLANVIRVNSGDHLNPIGAGALAEKIVAALSAAKERGDEG